MLHLVKSDERGGRRRDAISLPSRKAPPLCGLSQCGDLQPAWPTRTAFSCGPDLLKQTLQSGFGLSLFFEHSNPQLLREIRRVKTEPFHSVLNLRNVHEYLP